MAFRGAARPWRAAMTAKPGTCPLPFGALARLVASALLLGFGLPAICAPPSPQNLPAADESSSRRPLKNARALAQKAVQALPVEEIHESHPSSLAATSAAESSTLTARPPRQTGSESPQSPTSALIIEKIEFIGNRRIPRDTLRSRIFSREGDVLNQEALHRDFLALWNTQY
ncbi:MAG TPA: POTRA domain-containing protein, partial [Terriglobia bacterium]